MQYLARTRTIATGALVVIGAAALTLALIAPLSRPAEPTAPISDSTGNDTGVAVTDGWMHNEILNPSAGRGVAVTDGWMHNEILNPSDAGRGVAVTDGWMHNEILNQTDAGEATRYGPPGR